MPRKKNGFDLEDLEGSSDDNTWEPGANLGTGVTNAYEDGQQKKDKDTSGLEAALDENLASRKRGRRKKKIEEIVKPRGVDRGLQPEKILAAQLFNSSLFFLVKWQDCTDLDVVPGKDLNLHFPEFVIEYYESCVPFSVRHKIGKTPRVAPELPPEPIPEAPMDVSDALQEQIGDTNETQEESAVDHLPPPETEVMPQDMPSVMPEEQSQIESQPMELPVN